MTPADLTPALVQCTEAACPLCGENRPLPKGVTSPAFDKPDPELPDEEYRRRQALIANWLDPIQQLLAGECQTVRTGRHSADSSYG